MANTSNNKKKTTANKNTARQVVEATQNVEVASAVSVETVGEAVVETPVATPAAKATVTELPRDLYVPCVSLVRSGRLIYSSKRQMGYSVIWRNYMDTQYIELAELMAMHSSDPMFFSENWIMIDDEFEHKDAVVQKLRIKDMYVNAPNMLELERLFVMPVDEMVHKIKSMSVSLKESVYLHAKEAVENGTLDSMKRIKAIEGVLGKSIT